jgi:hypothetical protein
VVNTAFLVIKDKSSGNFYLSNGQTWYVAKNPKGPWSVTTNTPAAIRDFVKPDPDAEPQTGPPPQIITATVPTELIVTSGAPNWTALAGNQLLYVSNTESTFIKEIATNKYYLLLSGRWFSSRSLDGPWTYERSDSLPASFKQIPPASPVGDALTAVAGTNEAEDAEADAEIPQTAYDGSPQFQDIPSTQVQYAVNTSSSVLKIGDRYDVCDNGVWFAGLTPTGPWAVADRVPDAVQTIPPSAPVYNVRYVHVYDATPEIVYVGYTPGYIGTYRYYGTVVYGTGWYYRPWIGPVYYYPRPYTWGFNVIYNPCGRMGIRTGLQYTLHQREHRLEKRLLPLSAVLGRRRMVGTGRLPSDISSAAWIPTAIPATAKRDGDSAHRTTGKTGLPSRQSESAGATGQAWTSRQTDAIRPRQHLRATWSGRSREDGLPPKGENSEASHEIAEQCLHGQGERLPPRHHRQMGQARERQVDKTCTGKPLNPTE